MSRRSQRVTDTALFWAGVFMMVFAALVAGDLLEVTSRLSHFMAWLGGRM